MSENQNFGFGKFVPGFDFLQNLANGTSPSMPQMPDLSSWIAPTLNLEELEKRIGELKAVHFWLDQNSKALGATIQALEVQKMTLATLKGMNVSMSEMADALKVKPMDAMFSGARKAAEQFGGKSAPTPAAAPADAADGPAEGAAGPAASRGGGKGSKGGKGGASAGGVVDPLQWWGALTQQFQQIAATAMKDVAMPGAAVTPANPAEAASRKAAAAPRKAARKRTTKKSG